MAIMFVGALVSVLRLRSISAIWQLCLFGALVSALRLRSADSEINSNILIDS